MTGEAAAGAVRWRTSGGLEVARLTYEADWSAIAAWCGGTDEREARSRIVVPGPEGEVEAYEDAWIIKGPFGAIVVWECDLYADLCDPLDGLEPAAAQVSGPDAGEAPATAAESLLSVADDLISDAVAAVHQHPDPLSMGGWLECAEAWQREYAALPRQAGAGPADAQVPLWDWQQARNQGTPLPPVPGDAPEQQAAPPLPPGVYGRAELPGMRSHTGWRTDGMIGGQPCIVISNRAGVPVAEYILGPACRFVRLPVPATTAEAAVPLAIEAPWDDDDDPYDRGF
jgi:hypothetical protein